MRSIADEMKYIYQQDDWANFFWNDVLVLTKLAEVKARQGYLLGQMSNLGFEIQNRTLLDILATNIQKSSEIEGANLDATQIRSSIARKLNIEYTPQIAVSRNVEGAVEVTIDALENYNSEITIDRLFGWHAALFPIGYSSMYKIETGKFRTDIHGAMQVVSGYLGYEKVHYEAPPASTLSFEMERFLQYANSSTESTDDLIKAAIIHLWFVILYPFEDGNGRIARALTEIFLKRSDKSHFRFYSLSDEIMRHRKEYYSILEETQTGTLDVTHWILWFLNTLQDAMKNSNTLLKKVIKISEFWSKYNMTHFNERQNKIIKMLLNDFHGNLTSSKWAKICKCSQDTASRDINDLISKKILRKEGNGRNVHYVFTDAS